MKYYPQIEYRRIKVSPRKHIIIGTRDNVYHFCVRKLSTNKKVAGWKLVYSRKKIHIIEKEHLFSKETLDALFYFVNIFKKWNTQTNK